MAVGRPPPSFLASARPTRSPCSRESSRLRYRKYKCFHLEHFQPVDFYTGRTHGIVTDSEFRNFFRVKSSNTQFFLKNIITKSTTVAVFKKFSSTLNWCNNKWVGILIKNRELFKNCKTGVFRRSASPGGSNTCIFSTEWNGY